MAKQTHAELQELVAAFALHAVEADEVDMVEAHLATCPKCSAELQDMRDTAGYLSYAGSEAPTGLWDRIAGQLEDEPPADAMLFPFATAKPKPKTAAMRWRLPISIAAALVMTLAVGSLLVRQNNRIDQIDTRNISQLAEQLATRSSSKIVSLRSADGTVTADAVLGANGTAYLLHTNLPKLSGDETYQLWGIKLGTDPISLSVLGAHPKVVGFSSKYELDQLAITIERAGGSAAPTQSPLLSGALS